VHAVRWHTGALRFELVESWSAPVTDFRGFRSPCCSQPVKARHEGTNGDGAIVAACPGCRRDVLRLRPGARFAVWLEGNQPVVTGLTNTEYLEDAEAAVALARLLADRWSRSSSRSDELAPGGRLPELTG